MNVRIVNSFAHEQFQPRNATIRRSVGMQQPEDMRMASIRSKSMSDIGNGQQMGLSTPSLLTFLVSFVIMLAVLFARYFGATIPGLTGDVTQFTGLLVAYLILAIGCLSRSL